MSNTTLRVEFLGQTGLVPSKNGEQVVSYLVVLPDLSTNYVDPRLPQNWGAQCSYEQAVSRHFACVVVPSDDVSGQLTKLPALRFRCRTGRFANQDYSLYVFDRQRLEIDGLVRTALSSVVVPVDPNNPNTWQPGPGSPLEGLQWVPRLALSNIAHQQNVGTFDRQTFLNAASIPIPTQGLGLAGAMQVDTGRLWVGSVVNSGSGLAEFRTVDAPATTWEWKQALYDSLYWDTDLAGDQVTLSFDGESNSETVVLVNQVGANQIWVANMELDLLLQMAVPAPTPVGDVDYAVFYLTCTNIPQDWTAMPVAHPPRVIRGGGLRCKAAMFDA